MTTFTINAYQAQHYNTPSATMISVAIGAPALVRIIHDCYKTLPEVFESAYNDALATGAKCFSLRVIVNGRKPRGFDALAHTFRRDYIAPDAIPYM